MLYIVGRDPLYTTLLANLFELLASKLANSAPVIGTRNPCVKCFHSRNQSNFDLRNVADEKLVELSLTRLSRN